MIAVAIIILGFVILAPLIALISVSKFKTRLDQLERARDEDMQRIARLERDLRRAQREGAPAPLPRPEAAPWVRTEEAEEAQDEAPTPEPVDTAVAQPARVEVAEARVEEPQEPPRATVLRSETADALSLWLRENWVLAIGAVSLALAGVFMVQYGIETGLLTPWMRVIGAVLLGVLLIGAGEWLRRRYGDEGATTTNAIPSVLAGAGLVSMFAGVLAARTLYELIGPDTALIGLVAVAVVAVALGWFYGPVLAAVGIIGATTAPFLVGGQSDSPWVFYYFFAIIALAAMAVDTMRRWAWVTAVGLVATGIGAWMFYAGGAGEAGFLAFWAIAATGALILPERRWRPSHEGTTNFGAMMGQRPWPTFPTRVAAGMIVTVAVMAVIVGLFTRDNEVAWLSLGLLAALLGATTLWMRRAPSLEDMSAVPALAILLAVSFEGMRYGPLVAALRGEGLTVSPIIPALVTLAAWGAMLGYWRMRQAVQAGAGASAVAWALGAAVFGGGLALILEFLWLPAPRIGAYPWALHIIALAAVMTLLAERTRAGRDRADRDLRAGIFAVAALSLITLALFVILTKAALTLALAVMVAGTALLDRRANLPLLAWVVQLGVAVITYRALIDPGVDWAVYRAGLAELSLAYLGPMALMAFALWLLDGRDRPVTRAVLESGIWLLAALSVAIVLLRLFGDQMLDHHWGLGLMATLWLVSAGAQLYRLEAGGPGAVLILRRVLVAVFGLVALAHLGWQAAVQNPLMNPADPVLGPPVADSLAVAFLPVAAVFGLMAWWLSDLMARERQVLAGLSALYVAAYVGLEIRRLWRGTDLSVSGVSQPELYTYTVALLLVSVALLFVAFARRSVGLRQLAMAGVALTIAKVFLIDMAGLTGLIRVASFMGLGLSLAGLAWLNRVMQRQWDRA